MKFFDNLKQDLALLHMLSIIYLERISTRCTVDHSTQPAVPYCTVQYTVASSTVLLSVVTPVQGLVS